MLTFYYIISPRKNIIINKKTLIDMFIITIFESLVFSILKVISKGGIILYISIAGGIRFD